MLRRLLESALAAGVVVMHQLAGLNGVAIAVPIPQRDPQRGEDQVGALVGGGVPGHDALGEHIDDEGDVAEPAQVAISEVGHPDRLGASARNWRWSRSPGRSASLPEMVVRSALPRRIPVRPRSP